MKSLEKMEYLRRRCQYLADRLAGDLSDLERHVMHAELIARKQTIAAFEAQGIQ